MASVAHDELTETGSILSGPAELPDFPAWFRDQQRAAWKEFEALPKPTRKDQAWRFSNVDLLDVTSFKFAGALGDEERAAILEQSRGLDEVAGRMIFAGDQLIERDVISDQLKKRGVVFQSPVALKLSCRLKFFIGCTARTLPCFRICSWLQTNWQK